VRITIDIREEDLEAAMTLTGELKKGPAVTKAVMGFIRRERVNEVTRRALAGEFDYPLTNDELEAAEFDSCGAHGSR
jgi:hypothetical protein